MTVKHGKECHSTLSSISERQARFSQEHVSGDPRTSPFRTPLRWGWLLAACFWSLYLFYASPSMRTGLEHKTSQGLLTTPTPSAPRFRFLNLRQDENGVLTLVASEEDTDGEEQDDHGAATDDGNSDDSDDDDSDDDNDDAKLPEPYLLLEHATVNGRAASTASLESSNA